MTSSSIRSFRHDAGQQGAIDSYRIFFEAVPDMTAEIPDVVAADDRVAEGNLQRHGRGTPCPRLRRTPRPCALSRGKPFAMETMYIIRLNDEGKTAEHWGIGDMVGVLGQLGLLPGA